MDRSIDRDLVRDESMVSFDRVDGRMMMSELPSTSRTKEHIAQPGTKKQQYLSTTKFSTIPQVDEHHDVIMISAGVPLPCPMTYI